MVAKGGKGRGQGAGWSSRLVNGIIDRKSASFDRLLRSSCSSAVLHDTVTTGIQTSCFCHANLNSYFGEIALPRVDRRSAS